MVPLVAHVVPAPTRCTGRLSHWKKSEILQQQGALVRREKRACPTAITTVAREAEAHCFVRQFASSQKSRPSLRRRHEARTALARGSRDPRAYDARIRRHPYVRGTELPCQIASQFQ